MKRFARLMLFAALFEIGGLHWWALQVGAWVNMSLKDRSEYGLAESVLRSVSGEHPCDVCKKIQKTKVPVAKPWHLSDEKISVLPSVEGEQTLSFNESFLLFESANILKRSDPPLTPPPIS